MAEAPLVLIIDDVQSSRTQLAQIVESLGYRTAQAAGGLEALVRVRGLRPSLVLLDVVMPTFDGFKTAAAIRAMPRYVPIIMLTSLNDLETKRRGQAAGADDFLSKPVSEVELQIRMAAMLRIKTLTDDLEEARRQLAELADTDPLTGIANRRSFERTLSRECDRSLRYRRPLSLLMLDIDHFKRVNDTFGHPAGDAVIREVARAAASEARSTDTVGRLGGEEFAVLVPETPSEGAKRLAERIRTRVAELVVPHEGRSLQVTLSVGSATWACAGPLAASDLLRRADEALYTSKRGGRDRCTAHLLQAA